jgi:hypothetical protein
MTSRTTWKQIPAAEAEARTREILEIVAGALLRKSQSAQAQQKGGKDHAVVGNRKNGGRPRLAGN